MVSVPEQGGIEDDIAVRGAWGDAEIGITGPEIDSLGSHDGEGLAIGSKASRASSSVRRATW